MNIRNPKDFWAGIMFLALGIFFSVWATTHYQIGSAVRMGPAYFPLLLGGLLAIIGAIVFFGALRFNGPPIPRIHFRPLILVLGACLAYGYLMRPLGLVLATVAMVFIAAFGGHEFRWKEVALLSLFLVLFSVLVFVKGLTLPFPLWPDVMS